jgi:hypothetical protein
VETLFLMIDTVALVLVMVYSMKNDRLRPGSPEIGFFRMINPQSRVKKPAQEPVRRVRGL